MKISGLLRRIFLTNEVHKTNEGKTALVLGEKLGNDALFLHNKGYQVTVIDKNTEPLLQNSLVANSGIEIIEADITGYDFGSHDYDIILAINILSFVKEDLFSRTLATIATLLRTNGFFCFTLFGKKNDWLEGTAKSCFTYEQAVKLARSLPLKMHLQSTEVGYLATISKGAQLGENHKFIMKNT